MKLEKTKSLNIIYLLAIVGLYFLLNKLTYFATALNPPIFSQSSILLEGLKTKRFLTFFIGCILLTIYTFPISWRQLAQSDSYYLRFFIIVLVIVLGWGYGLYDYNFYFNKTHLFDRIALLLLALCLILRPSFVFLFLLVLLAIHKQFSYPFGQGAGSEWTYEIYWRLLILFGAFLVFRRSFKVDVSLFVWLEIIIIYANYFFAGISKLTVSPHWYKWILYNDIANFSLNAYQYGWTWWGKENILKIATFIRAGNGLLLITVMILEVGTLIGLISFRLFQWMNLGHIILHISIFIASGDTFWNWTILSLAILIQFYSSKVQVRQVFFRNNKPVLIAAIGLILFGNYLFHTPNLGWFDSNYVNHYKIYGVDQRNNKYEISKESFAPFDVYFTKGVFHYIHQQKILTGTFGGTSNYGLVKELKSLNVKSWLKIKASYGKSKYDPIQKKRFEQFLDRWYKNKMSPNANQSIFNRGVLSAPRHFYMHTLPKPTSFGQLHKIEIHLIESYTQGKRNILLQNQVVFTRKFNP